MDKDLAAGPERGPGAATRRYSGRDDAMPAVRHAESAPSGGLRRLRGAAPGGPRGPHGHRRRRWRCGKTDHDGAGRPPPGRAGNLAGHAGAGSAAAECVHPQDVARRPRGAGTAGGPGGRQGTAADDAGDAGDGSSTSRAGSIATARRAAGPGRQADHAGHACRARAGRSPLPSSRQHDARHRAAGTGAPGVRAAGRAVPTPSGPGVAGGPSPIVRAALEHEDDAGRRAARHRAAQSGCVQGRPAALGPRTVQRAVPRRERRRRAAARGSRGAAGSAQARRDLASW